MRGINVDPWHGILWQRRHWELGSYGFSICWFMILPYNGLMPTDEKFNAFWVKDEKDGEIVFEHYAEDLDLIGIVQKKKQALFRAVLLEKSHSCQWRLPFWAEIRPEALFDNQQDAAQYILTLLDNRRGGYEVP
jgi:hypothetical protein